MVAGSDGFVRAGVDAKRCVSISAETSRIDACSGSGGEEGAPVERSPPADKVDASCMILAGSGSTRDAT